MYITLVCFFIISFIFAVFGEILVFYFAPNEQKSYSIFENFFIGLCIAGAILNIWSIFLPTDVWSFLFLFLTALILFYFYYKNSFDSLKGLFFLLKSEKLFTVLIVIATFIVLTYAIVTPRLYDSYLYHINAIQWNEFYRAVPGLANFHDRFGFNSSIHVLSACFSFSALYNQYIFTISSLSFLVFFYWLLQKIYFKKGFVGLFSLTFLYYFIQQYALDISSPGTDLLPNIIIGFVLLSILFDHESLENKKIFYVILPLFCVTLKLSAFPIAFITIVALFRKNKGFWTQTKSLFGFGMFLLLPWLVKNVILSGYLIYPIDQLDLFHFDWKVSKQSIIEIKNLTLSFARIPFKDYHEVLKMPFNTWFSIWWDAALLKNKCFFVLASMTPLVYTYYYSFYKKERNLAVLLIVCVAYLSFLLWVFTAPDFRFIFSFILFLALFPLLIFKKIIEKFKFTFNTILFLALIYSSFIIGNTGYTLFSEDYKIKKVSEYIYLPKDVSEIKVRRNIQFNSVFFTTVKGKKIELFEPLLSHSQCYDKFPCSWYLNYHFNLRGENLQDGFTYKGFYP